MNIQDTSINQAAVDSATQTQQDDSSTSKDKKSDKPSKSFSKTLADKAAKKGEGSQQPDAPQAGAPQPFRETAPVVQGAKQTASVASLPPAMQNLVQEIAVARGPNTTQVDIQLNSKTFDGLKVTLTQKGGNVSIQMVSKTPEVAALLTRNVDQLSQALTARGVPVAAIQVQTIAQTRSSARGFDSRGDARGQGSRGGRQS